VPRIKIDTDTHKEFYRMPNDDLYNKLLNILIVLRDTQEHFKPYSAADIKKLIQSKLESKTIKEPRALRELYILENMIHDLRETLLAAKYDN